MDLTSQLFYQGSYAFQARTRTYVHIEFYLENDTKEEDILNTFSALHQYKQFKFIPTYHRFSGIYEFAKPQNNNIQPIKKHVHQLYDIEYSQLESTINQIANEPLDESIPWWDIYLIHLNNEEEEEMKYERDTDNNNNNNNKSFKCVLILRWDHTLCDGITFMTHIVPKLFKNKDGESLKINYPKPKRGTVKLSCCSILDKIILGFWSIVSVTTKSILHYKPMPLQLKIFQMGNTYGKQVFHHYCIPIIKLQKIHSYLNENEIIRNKYNIDYHISYNDIIMSFSSGAIRELLWMYSNDKCLSNIKNYDINGLLVVAEPTSPDSVTLANKFVVVSVPYLINISSNINRIIETAKLLKPIKNPWTLSVIFRIPKILASIWMKNASFPVKRIFKQHMCSYSMLRGPIDIQPFICGTKVYDVGVHVGDLQYTHMQEILMFNDKLSLNLSINKKRSKYANEWSKQFENIMNKTYAELNNDKQQHKSKVNDTIEMDLLVE